MVDEIISVSAANVLGRAQTNLRDAVDGLDRILQAVRSELSDSGYDEPAGRPASPYRSTLAATQLDLVELLGRLRSTADILEVLTATRQVGPTAARRAEAPSAIPLARVSVATQHRLKVIQDALKVDEQEACERSVATQAYVDDRLRAGWQFFVTRGRERRSVTFPGQHAV
ncbi:hypothetical protein GCM10009745_63630 [Kribbella yunnanensis]|uniref:Uncharacterized protein n=1 Tax=Kribbella yunnanensis TaxID=190194 RepID=A0ABP4UNI3_9ACTN